MKHEIHCVAEKAPIAGECVLRLQIEDGYIVAAKFSEVHVSICDSLEEEQLCREAGDHLTLEWEDDPMKYTDHWMSAKI